MIFEYINILIGVIKICLYKMLNFNRIKLKGIPKMNSSFKIAIQNKSILKIGTKFRSRNNVSFRIYNKGIVDIGDNCFFNDGCSINCQKKIKIGNNVIFGQNVLIFDHDHDYKNDINKFITKEVKIGNNVWIGANVIVLKGTTIGDNVVVAAGTIVKEDIPSNKMVFNKIVREERELK